MYIATATVAELVANRVEVARKKRKREEQRLEESNETSRPNPPAIAKWPGRLRQALATADSATSRADAEAEERNRWLEELVWILEEANCPALALAEKMENPKKALMRCGGGKRAKTLRKKLRTWKMFRKHLLRLYGSPWPTCISQVVGYAEQRAAEPCGPSFFDSFLQALGFMEKAAGTHESQMFSKVDWIKDQLMELKASMVTPESRGPARRFTIALVRGLEEVVLDIQELEYIRMLAWLILVMWWAILRWDDAQWMVPSTATMKARGFFAEISRTKTTGPDKKVVKAEAYVSSGAWLVDAAWLGVGLDLWKEQCYDRDYFLPLPTSDLRGCARREALYNDAATMFRLLLAKVPLGPGNITMHPDTTSFWSLHSMRHGMPAAATALGSEPEHVDMLGGWHAQGGRLYADQKRLVTERLQCAVAEAARKQAGKDSFDDDATIEKLKAFLAKQGWDEGDAEAQCHLVSSSVGVLPSLECASCRCSLRDAQVVLCKSCCQAGCTNCVLERLCLKCLGDEGKETVAQEDTPEASQEDAAKGYVICITNKTSTRRLHRAGACWRVPGIHYRKYEILGEEMPPPSEYNAICSDCWRSPKGASAAAAGEAVSSSGSSSSSQSDNAE